MDTRPIIAISMGDPFGNGAEVTAKLLRRREIYDICRPLVVGDKVCMEYALRVAGDGAPLSLRTVSGPADGLYTYGTVDLMDMSLISPSDFPLDPASPAPFGVGPCVTGGEAGFRYVEKVISLAMSGQVHATVTNAISKEAINMAGHHYSGHTEIYAEYTGTRSYAMLLAHDDLRVVHVSTHVSLREACDRVKKERVLECIRLGNDFLKQIGITSPRIAVAGLNPHCGEGGLFGREEIEEIQPAIDAALSEGILIPDRKPLPPDTVFSKAAGGWYDLVVVMYHDQGHIPLKLKGFVYDRAARKWQAVSGINMTLGLPIIRVSVDHGTGYDIAGTGTANDISLLNATELAAKLAN